MCRTNIFLVASLLTVAFAQSQSTTAVQWSATDDGGAPVPQAQITFRRIPQLVGPIGRARLAPGEVYSQGIVNTDSTGVFCGQALPAGRYFLCGRGTSGPYLDPCKWQSAVPVLIDGTGTSLQALTLKKGVFLNVQINDPDGLLPKSPGPLLQPRSLVVGVKFGSGAFLGMESISTNVAGQIYQMAIPVGTPLFLWLFSKTVAITDSSQKPVATGGVAIPFQASPGTDYSFSFTVAPLKTVSTSAQ
jgi:hypothetical protein